MATKTINQLPIYTDPLANPDVFHINVGGVDFQITASLLASSVSSLLGFTSFGESIVQAADASSARSVLEAEQRANLLAAITTLEDTDELIISDASDSGLSKKITVANLKLGLSINNPNLIINGQGLIAQRGTAFTAATTPANNNNTYLLDRQLYLASGADGADVSQETTITPDGAASAIKYLQATANIQTAYCQIIEGDDAAAIIGGVASLSFEARKGGSNVTLGTLRAALISWDSTKDVVTSDVVATWNGAGTNPTLAANWTYENTPSDLVLTTAYQKFKVENISIDTPSTTNVALFVWVDDTDATVGDEWYIGNIKVERGEVATGFVSRLSAQELASSQRFYEFGSFRDAGTGSNSGNSIGGSQQFAVTKRVTPTLTLSNVANTQSSNTAIFNNGTTGFSSNGNTTGTAASIQSGDWTADAEL